MLTLLDGRERFNRRRWLQLGGLSACGLSLSSLLRTRHAQAASPRIRPAQAKSCILVFLLGGPPQHETWDPKPDAPVEIRGDLQPIRSAVPGFWVGELFPRTSLLTDRICVLRAVSTKDNAHSTSGYAMTTGVPHSPLGVEGAAPGAPNDWPNLGGIVRALHGPQGALPASVTLPEIAANDGNKTWPGQNAGWLGRRNDPWLIEGDPSLPDFQIRDLQSPDTVTSSRFESRRALLQQIDRRLEHIRDDGALDGHQAWQRQALGLLTSGPTRAAFDLHAEENTLRDRYGRNRFGQSLLMARRLVESGVSLVQVNWTRIEGALNNGHWDTHTRNTDALKHYLMPRLDIAYSALLEDLERRGMLEETLVVMLGEFGRTPRINANGGRDHWGNVFSIAMAGGGVQGGQCIGESDRDGAFPIAGQAEPADVTATIFEALGHDPQTVMYDPLDRPHPISRGTPIPNVLS